MEKVDCVVVGAGVVGLAVARELAMAGREVIVLEAADAIGTETSSRNSEVIHAGIYYPSGSLKARTCVEGKQFLYGYCVERGVEHTRCGKLIVATSEEQLPRLAEIQEQAAANGVVDLEVLTAETARSMEPAIHCVSAVWSPSTGIIDSHGLMLAYQGDAEDHGSFIAFNSRVVAARATDDGIIVSVVESEQPMSLLASIFVNASGLNAPAIAKQIDGLAKEHLPASYLCKGNYYTLPGKAPFTRLIYPVPEQAGLGVHVTLDLGGQCRFGPDVEWIDQIDYEVDPSRSEVFYDAIRRYWPDINDGTLEPGYSGVRPKLVAQGEPAADFRIDGPDRHGVPGLVNMFGIESPGLTASRPLALEVLKALRIDGKP
ncbi:MAG: NAD(P)/FAD-dependent oxidoreductase [Pseudomonadota bacterium]